ncbi:DHA1 family inner membrane transport protein [Leucobacter luti]|uniref:MFS transporter n=1 Tax=Leucobacter luti TaxID=340320 RepID=UPI0010508ACF|nr:MFS transporter [Leucobacter luti]MCW2289271.1 DHA1 family inner membrane transport protein [Leucobacter luti]TCK39834.1 DHA1 family inner membrane transport protein [Leucobacter luti]
MSASRWILIAALACGGFGIGVSEFLVMGLLPQIAEDLLPELVRSHRDAALAATGGMASAYAAGVAVGIFTTPLLVRRLSERHALLVCAGSMVLWTVLTALAPTLPIALALRFLSALTHASFIGLGAMAIAHVLGSRSYGRGSAIVHGGLALANLAGVPALTAVGAVVDWRVILGSCALLFAAPLLALVLVDVPDAAHGTSAPSTARVRTKNLVLLFGSAIVGAAGGFTILTYVAPVTLWTRGDDTWVTAAIAMLAFGIGMNLGNLVSGILADRAAGLAFGGAICAGVFGAALLLIPGAGGVMTVAGVLLIGVLLGGQGPAGQVLYLRELSRFPRLAASLPSGTGNLGSFAGALFGAGLLAGFGPGVIPIGAGALLIIALVAFFGYTRLLRSRAP